MDATAGFGGHLRVLLDAGVCRAFALDRDPRAVRHLQETFPDDAVSVVRGRFADPDVLERIARFCPDFILLDLGVSSPQLDEDRRGFTFRANAPLDMRMDTVGPSAADLLNGLSQSELQELFATHADERRASRLAREIVRRRETRPFETSDDFVNAIRAVLGPRSGPPDFARLFQAIRIEVNGELDQLETALPALRDALQPGGDIAVIAYHSGEDRLVKHAFRSWSRSCVCPPDLPVCSCRGTALGEVRTRKPLRPDPVEAGENVRARSARLRVFRRAAS